MFSVVPAACVVPCRLYRLTTFVRFRRMAGKTTRSICSVVTLDIKISVKRTVRAIKSTMSWGELTAVLLEKNDLHVPHMSNIGAAEVGRAFRSRMLELQNAPSSSLRNFGRMTTLFTLEPVEAHPYVYIAIAKCALTLLKMGRVRPNEIGSVLHRISLMRDVRRHDLSMLGPYLSFALHHFDRLPVECAMRCLASAPRLRIMETEELLRRVMQRVSGRLSVCNASEITLLIDMWSNIFGEEALLVEVLNEYRRRINEFSAKQCQTVLLKAAHLPFVGNGLLRIISNATFEHLLKGPSNFRPNDIGRCARNVLVVAQGATLNVEKAKQMFVSKLQAMPLHSCSCFLLAFGFWKALDAETIDQLWAVVTDRSREQPRAGWASLLKALTVLSTSMNHLSTKEALVRAVAEEFEYWFNLDRTKFPPDDLAVILPCLVKQRVGCAKFLQKLFMTVLSLLPSLSEEVIPGFIRTCSLFQSYICEEDLTALRNYFSSRLIPGSAIFKDSIFVICKALVQLNYREVSWLREIAVALHSSLDSYLMEFSDLRIQWNFAVCVRTLSSFRYNHPDLFHDLYVWLEEEDRRYMLNDANVISIVTIVWACVVQGVYPKRALGYLLSLPSLAVKAARKSSNELLRVRDLNIVAQLKCGLSSLHVTSRQFLHKDTVKHLEWLRTAKGMKQFVADVTALFPYRCILMNFMTDYTVPISCALLLGENGSPKPWPGYVGVGEVSEVESKQLREDGFRPVAVLCYLKPLYFVHSSDLLGHHWLRCHLLHLSGWETVPIDMTAYAAARDRTAYLDSEFKRNGVNLVMWPE